MSLEPPRWLERLAQEEGSPALEKAIHGDRLEPPEIEELVAKTPLHALAAAADYYARRLKRGRGSFTKNLYITYTNVCVTRCSFCAFYRLPGSPEAYTRSPGEIAGAVRRAAEELGIVEVHMVGGNNPELPFSYYEELVSSVKRAAPRVALKAFTAEEILFIARSTGHRVREVLERLRELGLDALSGGGAEILDEGVQRLIAPLKPGPEEYLRVHEEAHRLGIRSNVIMMYGHVEEPIHVARHIYRVRLLEEKAPGFISFIPVRFNPGSTPLGRSRLYRERARLDGQYDLRIVAAARLALLGAVDNIVAYWVSMGDKLAQAALAHGANDLGGTFYREAVITAAGGGPGGKEPGELAYMLRQAGWEPWLRDTFYNYLERVNTLELPWLA
ncbi:hypothetical protein CF15_08065 [Pyrodictium occultum]|uniref:Radical SAM core domain-containing protein n=1 Tax=Pyrodictium occultum TaxID=2309 RepID=A0A0V8RRT5_PYROC|nr:CofH family radical SAM protein [Pyrodictium occultum]KSW10729.1 hypothetical protein CF15_08065 [Pyrodictium occultum]